MVTLIIEVLFALVFLHLLVAYVRRREPLHRDLMLVFVPFASLLVLEIVRRVRGDDALPLVVGYISVTLLLAQPYLTLRLVRTLRPVPRWVMRLALGIFLVTTVPLYFLGERDVPLMLWAVVIGFFAVQGLAAKLLADEARRRIGAPRARLMLAALATGVLGLCLLVAGVGAAAGPGQQAMQITAQVLALLSGVSYVVAFMPPRWLRQLWAGGAMYRVHRQLVDAPITETPEQTWQRYATTVREVSGAEAAVVLLPADTGPSCMAVSGDVMDGELKTTSADLERMLNRPQPVLVPEGAESPLLSYARRVGARVLSAVPLQLSTPDRGALLLLSRRNLLFFEDDARMLGELGVQVAILAERGAVAETIRTLNTQLEQRVQERTAQLRKAQASLEDANVQLEKQNTMLTRSNEELQRFAYVASHDLQEPLRKIISFSGLLTEHLSDSLDPDTQMYIDRITTSAARMRRLIEDLLMFSRSGGSVDSQPVNCGSVLRAVLDSLAVALDETGASVTYDSLPTVLANRTPMEQLFQNVIGNALKYRSEVPPLIHINAERCDGHWRMAVTDNGIGIDMNYAERIFQVFQRLHPRGQYEGTGIGLAVCKRIVESYGGQMGVESTLGVGSKFWFTFPAMESANPEVTDAAPNQV